MHYLWQHLENILTAYDGKLPLHHFLKAYFKQHPKLGSRDRRGLSDAVYGWCRAGKTLEQDRHDLPLKRLAAMQLCGLRPKAFALFFPEEWRQDLDESLSGFSIQRSNIFPYDIPFSEGILREEWISSLLRQPRLFLRIRKDHAKLERILRAQGIGYEWITRTCLALPNSTKLDGLFPEDAYVVQDASSQATGEYLYGKSGEQWWDCCSGAGGKSLMLADNSRGIHLLTTDVRESILQNLSARFRQYQLPQPERRVLDAANASMVNSVTGNRRFEGIICDVPCSGSGTWARTPESCYFFKPETLDDYSQRQRSILSNAANYINANGRIIYITCSVFREENEAVIAAVASEKNLQIETSRLINGVAVAADSLFIAVLRSA